MMQQTAYSVLIFLLLGTIHIEVSENTRIYSLQKLITKNVHFKIFQFLMLDAEVLTLLVSCYLKKKAYFPPYISLSQDTFQISLIFSSMLFA